MKRKIDFPSKTIFTDQGTATINSITIEEPTECPICHYLIRPIQVHIHSYTADSKCYLSMLYQCTQCHKPFIAFHHAITLNRFDFEFVAPVSFVAREFNKLISTVSPSFVKIFNQAVAAEAHNLDEIAGLGYRKALEFLIKDLVIHTHQEVREKIEGMHLSDCINKYVNYPPLKTSALGSAWLGNDQTHYKQKFSDRDLSDLKRFMENSIKWVDLVLGTEDAAALISNHQ